jgi:hypothetical protein
MALPEPPLTGGCQCGQARYRCDVAPVEVYCCHCLECRHQSASAFGISVIVPRAALHRVQGEVRTWTRRTDSGGELHCVFCPHCGSRLWHDPGEGSATLSIKGGSLDVPVDLNGAHHIWTARALPGVLIPDGARCWPGEPD